jgi:hypothetical protein
LRTLARVWPTIHQPHPEALFRHVLAMPPRFSPRRKLFASPCRPSRPPVPRCVCRRCLRAQEDRPRLRRWPCPPRNRQAAPPRRWRCPPRNLRPQPRPPWRCLPPASQRLRPPPRRPRVRRPPLAARKPPLQPQPPEPLRPLPPHPHRPPRPRSARSTWGSPSPRSSSGSPSSCASGCSPVSRPDLFSVKPKKPKAVENSRWLATT